ncbi:FAD-binding oxidoreductase [Spirillospora albida]|uniref:FAD-binding oxidoreductase n=1 Tax=Spirillospora albida TaxID=58123 RepID=UPI0004BF4B16|nr:FAD-binding oxidoreductase [Spirillospora albida]
MKELASKVQGPVFVPGADGYDDERTGFQLAAPHRPAVIVGATCAEDVRAALEYAAAHDLPVAVQSTGHGLPVGSDEGLLISTRRMTGSRVADGAARVEAGVRWGQVVEEAASHGLAPLSGSHPGVGAVSFTLGGGVGLLSRKYGYAADHVRSMEVVTADAELRRVTPDTDPDLYWALLGGRANFGVVTSMEFGLVPVTRLYGGGLYFDADPDVLETWRTWTPTVPDEMTSSIAIKHVPNAPMFPEPLRGRHVAHVRIAHAGDPAEGERLIAPFRALGPRLIDTVTDMPYTSGASIYSEPPGPLSSLTTSVALDGLSADTARAVVDVAGAAIIEFRHLDGALARPPAVPNAVGNRDAKYLAGVLSPLDMPGDHGALHDRFRRMLGGRRLLNFLFGPNANPDMVRAAYEPATYRRLARLKAAYDPSNLFRLNHNIPPAP